MSLEEQEEIKRGVELAELTKPVMRDGLDVSLLTQTEVDLMQQFEAEHELLFRRKAEELRFYPDVLNDAESRAVLRCMTYEELRPFYKIMAIKEKNKRLQTMLALKKVDLRRYCNFTKTLSDQDESKLGLPDVSIAAITEKYFAIMKEKGEIVYDAKYYFVSGDHKNRIIEVYAKSILEKSADNVHMKVEPQEVIA